MEFSFNADQRAIAALAESLFAAHGSDKHVRALAEAGHTLDRPLWAKLADTGLLTLVLPESGGGSGVGMLELGLVLEQQGRFLAAAPLWQHVLAGLAVQVHAAASLRERVLPGIARGTHIAALATELHGHVGLSATADATGWTLDGGLATVLVDAAHGWLLAPAMTADGIRLFLLPADLPGMRRSSGTLTDMQTICDLAFDGAQVAADSALAEPALDWLEPRTALCITALQLGVLDESLKRAAQYVSERQQFGRPLGSFQALAVRAADAYIEVELLRSAQWQLAWRIDGGLPAIAAARTARHQASQAGHLVGHTAIHFHGGVGADLTYPIHRFYLKSQALGLTGGSAEDQLARIGRALAGAGARDYIHE